MLIPKMCSLVSPTSPAVSTTSGKISPGTLNNFWAHSAQLKVKGSYMPVALAFDASVMCNFPLDNLYKIQVSTVPNKAVLSLTASANSGTF